MGMIPTPHITAAKEDFAETVLMPGDPMRSKFIAENYLTDAHLVNNVRGIQGYTGLWKGKRVSVMASGMGVPSMGIYSYELFHFYDVQNIIRIGSAGAMQEKMRLRDIVFAMAASTDSAYMNQFRLGGSFAPICDWRLLAKGTALCEKQGKRYFAGGVLTSDCFYSEDTEKNTRWQKLGILCVEMETAALYANAARAGKSALSILTVSDHLITGESTSAEERQNTFRDMMEIALELA